MILKVIEIVFQYFDAKMMILSIILSIVNQICTLIDTCESNKTGEVGVLSMDFSDFPNQRGSRRSANFGSSGPFNSI